MPGEIFKLIGLIGVKGLKDTTKGLKQIDGQARKAARELDVLSKRAQKLGSSFTKFLTVPLIGAGVAMTKGIDLASDLAETQSAVGQVFGESASQIEAWSKTSDTALGQTKTQALEAAANFATFGKSAGLAGKDLVNFSTTFVELASDLASFKNTTPEEAITAIGAAMRGESEPLRRYGVLLDDATMRQEAMRLGLIKTTKQALTPQQKVIAASELVLKQTTDAMGDFKRTSDGLANSKRILNAQIQNIAADLGSVFLPVVLKVTNLVKNNLLPAIQAMVDWFKDLSPGMQKTILQLGLIAAALGPTIILVGKLVLVGKALIPLYALWLKGQLSLNAAMAANPIGFVITLLAALVAAGVVVYNNWDAIKEKTIELWDAIQHYTKQGVSLTKEFLFVFAKSYLELFKTITDFIPGLNTKVDAAIEKLGEMMAKEKEVRSERKIARLETKKQKLANEELTKAVDMAKNATEKYTAATSDLSAARSEDTDAAKKQAEKEKELLEKRQNIEDEYAQKFREQSFTKLQLLEFEKQEAITAAREVGADIQDIELFYMIERMKLLEEEAQEKDRLREEEIKKEQQKQQQIKQFLVDSVSQGFSILSQANENKKILIDNELATELKAIEESSASEEEKEQRKAEAEKKADEERKKLMRRQAQNDKAAAIFGAIVNTAQGISKALTLTPPLSFIMAGITGALGAAQIATIAAEPLPKFEKGGMVKGGHGGLVGMVAEKDQDELIMPMETGVSSFIELFFKKLQSMPINNEPSPAPLQTSNEPSMQGGRPIVAINNLFGDDRSIKELSRVIGPVMIMEKQRMGMDG